MAPPTEQPADTLALEVVADMASALRRSGQDIALAAALLGFVMLGLLVQAPAIWELHGPLAPIRFAVLCALAAGMLRGVSLLALTNGRLLRPLGDLRRTVAAPVKRGWRPLLAPPPKPTRQRLLEHVQLTVAAAYDRCYLAHGALQWALCCVGGFAVWTLLNVIGGTAP